MLQRILDLEGKRNPLQWSEQTVMPHKGNICKNGNSFFRPHSGIRVRYTSDKQAILNLCLGIWESEMHSWQAKSHHTSLLRNRQSPNKRLYCSYSNNYYTYLYVYVYLPSEYSCRRKLCKKIVCICSVLEVAEILLNSLKNIDVHFRCKLCFNS